MVICIYPLFLVTCSEGLSKGNNSREMINDDLLLIAILGSILIELRERYFVMMSSEISVCD